jgi:uncharacterized HAD superfamily protein
MPKICALDIDGVLNDYPQCWIDFVNLHFTHMGRDNFFNDLNQMKATLSYAVYKELKHKYRTSEFKLLIPPRISAANVVRELKNKGYTIVIITSRPFDEYPELRVATMRWLDMHSIEYDDIIESRFKHLDVLAQYPNLDFIVDDNRYIANNFARLGFRAFLLKNQYNNGPVVQNVTRVSYLLDVLSHV